MTVIGYYSPTATPSYENGKLQLGAYFDTQEVNPDTIAGYPEFAAYAVLANYLHVLGMDDKFHQFLPDVFPGDQLAQTWMFKPE